MIMMKIPRVLTIIIIVVSFCSQFHTKIFAQTEARQDSIISHYLKHGAWRHSYLRHQWQVCIDSGLKEDSTVAYLWQQKAMPLFKMGKSELAMQYLDKAVRYDSSWFDYRAFMKCIFGKKYAEAIADLKECNIIRPGGAVMDHEYDFYIGISYLQLNKFDSARHVLENLIERGEKLHGRDWPLYLDIFYAGIACYELEDFDKAIAYFDRSLEKHPRFSDAKYYKGICLRSKGDESGGAALMKEAHQDFKDGFTIDEDNEIYEPYPYQVNWKMVGY